MLHNEWLFPALFLVYSSYNGSAFLLDRVVLKNFVKRVKSSLPFCGLKEPTLSRALGKVGQQTHISEHRVTNLLSSVLREGLRVEKKEERCGKSLCSYCGALFFESCSECAQGTLAPISRQLSNSLGVCAFPLP